MADPGWKRPFDEPIPLPRGRELATLRDSGEYIAAPPQSEQQQANWHTAAEMLMQAAEGRGLLMFADVAVRQALSHGKAAPDPEPRRKAVKKYRVVR
jgi:hypothetical protein